MALMARPALGLPSRRRPFLAAAHGRRIRRGQAGRVLRILPQVLLLLTDPRDQLLDDPQRASSGARGRRSGGIRSHHSHEQTQHPPSSRPGPRDHLWGRRRVQARAPRRLLAPAGQRPGRGAGPSRAGHRVSARRPPSGPWKPRLPLTTRGGRGGRPRQRGSGTHRERQQAPSSWTPLERPRGGLVCLMPSCLPRTRRPCERQPPARGGGVHTGLAPGPRRGSGVGSEGDSVPEGTSQHRFGYTSRPPARRLAYPTL